MKILKVINHNTAIIIDDSGTEKIVLGKGIAFNKKEGQIIDSSKVERTFVLEGDKVSEYINILSEIPKDILILTDEIVSLVKSDKSFETGNMLFFTLADHINFAVKRYFDGISLKNKLLWEINRLYPDEYKFAKKALALINSKLNIELPVDEAGFISMHFVAARLNGNMEDAYLSTKLIQDILNIVKYFFNINYEEESLDYLRFVLHLKFFAQRLFLSSPLDNDDFLYNSLINHYPDTFRCVKKIGDYIKKEYSVEISKEEITYLIVHIQRVRAGNAETIQNNI